MNSFIRKWGEHIIRSCPYAAAVALLLAFLSFFNMPMMSWLSTVIVALVTLQNGARQGLIVITWAILPAIAMLYLGQLATFLSVLFLQYLLIWCFAIILRKSHSWVTLLQFAAVLGMLAVIMIYFFAPDFQNLLINQLTVIFKKSQSMMGLDFKLKKINNWLQYLPLFATGLFSLAILLSNLTALFLARWWQLMVYPSSAIQKECYQIKMNYLAALVLIPVVAGLCFNSSLFINVLIVAMVPFIFSSLSLVHAFAATKKNGNTFLFIFYILFLFLSPYIVLLLTITGWTDSFFDFRKKFITHDVVEE